MRVIQPTHLVVGQLKCKLLWIKLTGKILWTNWQMTYSGQTDWWHTLTNLRVILFVDKWIEVWKERLFWPIRVEQTDWWLTLVKLTDDVLWSNSGDLRWIKLTGDLLWTNWQMTYSGQTDWWLTLNKLTDDLLWTNWLVTYSEQTDRWLILWTNWLVT